MEQSKPERLYLRSVLFIYVQIKEPLPSDSSCRNQFKRFSFQFISGGIAINDLEYPTVIEYSYDRPTKQSI